MMLRPDASLVIQQHANLELPLPPPVWPSTLRVTAIFKTCLWIMSRGLPPRCGPTFPPLAGQTPL